MRPEVELYFDTRFGGTVGFIQAGRRRGIDSEAILKACEMAYDNIYNGQTLVSIGQMVHAYARQIAKKKTHIREKRLDGIEQKVNEIIARIDEARDLKMRQIDIKGRESQLLETMQTYLHSKESFSALCAALIKDIQSLQLRIEVLEKNAFGNRLRRIGDAIINWSKYG